jgi:nucleoside-diphosphate-sugar epimerase
MKVKSVLIVGCGDLGARAGALLHDRGWQVAGVRRSTDRLPAGFTGHRADYTEEGSLGFLAALEPDYLLTTFNPAEMTVEGYRSGFLVAMQNTLAGLGAHRPRGIIMVSSTRVFAEREGGWVDETSELVGDDPRALAIIEAERALLSSGHTACVVRFGGIYGAPDGRLLARIRRGELCAPEPVRYTNRIHRQDCGGFLAHLLLAMADGVAPEPVYIGVDDDPAPRFEVESWLARELGVAARPGFRAPESPGGHKRCSNRRLHASGYRLLYPDYRSGYRAVLDGEVKPRG